MLVRINKRRGFTLIELAVVLFIVSLMLGVFLTPLSARLEQQDRARTTDMLDDIEESLLGYAIINGRLPCPDCSDGNVGTCAAVAVGLRNDGAEDRFDPGTGNNICRSDVGNLPWVDLQVSENDAWGRHYTYRVTIEFADDEEGTPSDPVASCANATVAIGVSFVICSAGDIDIYNTYDADYNATYQDIGNVANNVPAIVISHASDNYEPSQTDQQVENYDRDPVNPLTGNDILTSYTPANFTPAAFVYTGFAKDSSLNPPIKYDDLIMWISPAILMNRMVISGKLP